MILHQITSLSQPEVAVYSQLTESQLRQYRGVDGGLFICESPKVIRVALAKGYEPVSLLMESRHIEGDAADIIAQCPADTPVFTGSREQLQKLTGYALTRGVLCAMRRPKLPTLAEVCRGASRVVVIDGVVDTTNVGAIFRSAAALGIDGVLLTTHSCDPLCRRSVRVSMGSVFLVPWTWMPSLTPAEGGNQLLRKEGFRTVAMALTERSVSIDDPRLLAEPRLAIVMGTEGDGLPKETIASTDYVARIPMSHDVDSLNVAAAAAVAFWQLRRNP